MKRCLAALLALFVLLAFAGCASTQKSSQLSDIYLQTAQQFTDDGDLDSAIGVLEEGIAATNDSRLAAFLDEVKAMQLEKAAEETVTPSDEAPKEEKTPEKQDTADNELPEEPIPDDPGIDIADYLGVWTETAVTSNFIVRSLDLSAEGDMLNIYFCVNQSPPWCRTAEVYESVNVSEIHDSTLSIDFIDSWGNSGTLSLSFDEESITCATNDLTPPPEGADWSVGEGIYTFTARCASWSEINAAMENANLASSLSQDERYGYNLFLSNFSEQCFGNYPTGDAQSQTIQFITFAYLYNSINASDRISVMHDDVDYYYAIEASRVDSTLQYFFGSSLTHPTGNQSISNSITYYDGYYLFPAADGEYYGYLSIIDSLYLNEDNTYTAGFSVYSFSPDVYYNSDSLYSYYAFSASQASQCADLSYRYSGEAVLDVQTGGDGSISYRLRSYLLNDY